MRRVCFITRPSFRSFGQHYFVYACQEVMTGLGWEAERVHMDDFDHTRYGPEDLIFTIDCVTVGGIEQRGLRKSKAFKIYYNMEPIPCLPHYISRSIRHVEKVQKLRMDGILDYNGHSAQWWRDNGYHAAYCGLAYHESYERSFPEEQLYPDGVYYLGRERGRRGTVAGRLRAAGKLPVQCLYLRGKNNHMERLNCSPGIHLNLHRINNPFHFGGIRVVIMGLSNARFVLSEACDWVPEGLTAGEHWDMANGTIGDLVEKAKWWFERPDERERAGRAGQEFVRKHHRLDVELPRGLKELGVI